MREDVMKQIKTVVVACAVMTAAYGQALAAESSAAKAIELPAADRAVIDKLLGPGVVGAPVAGNPIADLAKDFAFRDGTWTYRFVSGKQKGKTQQDVFTVSKRGKAGTVGRLAAGTKDVDYLRRSDDGGIVLVSEQDNGEGVISRYAPPEPILIPGLEPGDSRTITIAVKVYDLGDPTDVSHTGSLNLTYSYLGAYKVTVPAGTYDAALLKWDYEGEVGPASIKDFQYRLVAKDAAMVASIDRLKVSAFLLYNDNTKSGRVLVSRK
jgi:hypothetical protein